MGLRSGSMAGRGDHLLPTTLLILVPPVTTTELASGLGFPTEVGLDGLLIGGVLGGDV